MGLDKPVVRLLRKTVLRQGHAQELFQARVEEAVGRLAAAPERDRPPPAAPLPLTDRDLEPLLAPFRRALLVRLLRESFAR